MKHALLLVALLATGQAQAINKCTGPDGSTVFQDAPCAGKGESITVRPASGPAAAVQQTTPAEPKQSEAQRLEAGIAKSQRERRLRDLQEREVPRAEAAIQSHIAACQKEQADIEARKYRYVQNLYGKTDAAQAAAEQSAAAARCDTKDRDLRANAERLRRECIELGGCP